ncbi:MAG: hypothetical protein LBT41_03920 [Candidatus Methanoplasma sp.]|jgi:predicted outer membrane repeat protein|nr:hypothetical protein [Candidatus Methanoplasma sp.]
MLYCAAAVAVTAAVILSAASALGGAEPYSGGAVIFEGETSLTEDVALDGTVEISSDTTITGNGRRITRADGMAGPMFTVSEGAVLSFTDTVVDGSLSGGESQSMIIVSGGTLVLGSGSVLSGNAAASDVSGGAVFLDGASAHSSLDIVGGRIEGNTAGLDGGGIAATGDAAITFTSGTVRGNTAGRNGGGVHIDSGSLHMSGNAEISYNRAGEGGGIYLLDSFAELSGDSSVANNRAGAAGGIRMTSDIRASEMTVTDSAKVANNESDGAAGGILAGSGSILTLSGECIVSCNISFPGGDGVHIEEGAFMNASGAPEVGISISDNGIVLGRGTAVAVVGALGKNARINIKSVAAEVPDGAVVARDAGGSSREDVAKHMLYTANMEYAVIPGPSGAYVLSYEERYEIIADIPRDPYVFPMAVAEYGPQSAVTVVVYNVGNHDISHLKASIAGGDASGFTISALSGSSFRPGGSQSFTLRPADGLPAGTYESTVAVAGSNGTESSFRISFFVSAYRSALIGDSIGEEPYKYKGLIEGYETPDPLTVTIHNAGDRAVNGLRATVGGRDADMFVVGSMSERNLSSSVAECTFSVTPVSGLVPGTYMASISVTGQDGAFTIFTVSVTVSKDPGPGLGRLAIAIAVVLAAAAGILLYLFVLRKPVGVVKSITGEGIAIIGTEKARTRRKYVFHVTSGGRPVAVTYRIGNGAWKIPGADNSGKYEIPAAEIKGCVTIQVRG